MISIALCDDNEIQRDVMCGFLTEYGMTRNTEFAVFRSGEELLRHVKKYGSFDIYVLDVVMPGINGIEVAATLRQMNDTGDVIFTTASIEYAVMSYEVDAFYYMTKPVEQAKLFRILDKACAKRDPNDDALLVRTKSGEMRLVIKNIMYVELIDRAPVYHLRDGRVCEAVKLRGTFREAVEPLIRDGAFVFCGVSKAVNLKYVDAMDSESLLLFNGTQLFFPRSAYAALRAGWLNFGNWVGKNRNSRK